MKGKVILFVLILLATAASAIFFFNRDDGVSSAVLKDFAIADTTSISRIYMADHMGRTVDLTREENGLWMADGRYQARQDAAALLVKTFKRIKVKSTVPGAAKENIIKQIIAKHVKVEVYMQGEDTPAKIYWVGNATKDGYGSYMLLEEPEVGRSTDPFIVDMPGFHGSLNSRFHADVFQWRHSGIYTYKSDQIKSLTLVYHEEPQKSFRVEQEGLKLSLWDPGSNRNLGGFDSLRTRNYLSFYEKVHYEKFERRASVNRDSILKTQPLYSITVEDKQGNLKKMDIWRKAYEGEEADEEGNPLPYDTQRMYALVDGEDFVTLQNFHVDRLFVPVGAFGAEPVVNK